MSSIDKFFGRVYHARRYNCAHFVVDVLEERLETKLHDQFQMVLTGPADRYVVRDLFAGWKRVRTPTENAIVVFSAARTAPHVGVCINRKVLHLHHRGVEYQPVEVVGQHYRSYRFYECQR